MGRRRGESGQVATEYLGILVVIALVTAFLVAAGPAKPVAVDLKGAICRILSMGCGGDGTSAADGTSAPGTQGGTDEDTGCHGFLGCAWGGVKQVGSGFYNIGKGAVDDVKGLVHVVTHPGSLIDAGKYIWDHPWDAAKSLVWDDESGTMWGNGDYGGAIGRTAWNVGSWFIPFYDIGKAGSKIGKLGELGRLGDAAADLAKVSKLADGAADALAEAERLAAKGDYAAARKAAEEAEAKAADAKKLAGCPVAMGGGGRGTFMAAPFLSGPFLAATPCDQAREAAKSAAKAQKLAADLATAEKANPLVESLRDTGGLPSNFVTKDQAAAAGWEPGKALGNYVPGGQIGGDVFVDPASIGLPTSAGRTWYEADVGLNPGMTRAKQPGTRLLYSSDGLAYVTSDHYGSVYELPRWK